VNVTLRPYVAADEAAAIALWRRTWQAAYPAIDFDARVAWWRQRWRDELLPRATVVIAEAGDAAGAPQMVGFVTVDPRTGYLDQIVVAPEAWGTPASALLIAAARQIAPAGLELHVNQDNRRAVRFYEKHGFAVAGTDVNARSHAPVYVMRWRGENETPSR
jgi:putative acetyltransferase